MLGSGVWERKGEDNADAIQCLEREKKARSRRSWAMMCEVSDRCFDLRDGWEMRAPG